MSDNLEKFIIDNRQALDSHQPDAQSIWRGIERGLGVTKSRKIAMYWRAAAIFLAFLCTVQLTYILTSQSKASFTELSLVSEKSGAFERLEASYRQELILLEQRLAAKNVDPEEYEVFFQEMEFIKQVEDEFKEEIPLTSDREKLASILIDTYEKKIRLLERLLQQVDRNEQQEQFEEGLMPMKNNHKSLAI